MVLLDAPVELEVVAGLGRRVLLEVEPGLPHAPMQACDLDVLLRIFLLEAWLREDDVHLFDHVPLQLVLRWKDGVTGHACFLEELMSGQAVERCHRLALVERI